MRGPVRGTHAMFIEHGAQHLGTFKHHLHHVPVMVILHAALEVTVKYEDVQTKPFIRPTGIVMV